MSISDTVREMNARLFALEGRMTKHEALAVEDREYRKEVHARLLKGQEELNERVSKLALKLAALFGGVAVIVSIPTWLPFLQKLLVKGP